MFLFQLCRKYQQHFHQTFLKILTIEIIRYIGTFYINSWPRIGTTHYHINRIKQADVVVVVVIFVNFWKKIQKVCNVALIGPTLFDNLMMGKRKIWSNFHCWHLGRGSIAQWQLDLRHHDNVTRDNLT